MYGDGRYDEACTIARMHAQAHTALLVIAGGKFGQGFTIQTTRPEQLVLMPQALRSVADEIERQLREGGVIVEKDNAPPR